jgi:hypothetical protein
MVIIPGSLLVLIGFSISFLVGLLAAGFCYGAVYLLMHSKQATQFRAPAKFRVSKAGVEVGGMTIAKNTIHRVIVRNHIQKSAENLIVVANCRAGGPIPRPGRQAAHRYAHSGLPARA